MPFEPATQLHPSVLVSALICIRFVVASVVSIINQGEWPKWNSTFSSDWDIKRFAFGLLWFLQFVYSYLIAFIRLFERTSKIGSMVRHFHITYCKVLLSPLHVIIKTCACGSFLCFRALHAMGYDQFLLLIFLCI